MSDDTTSTNAEWDHEAFGRSVVEVRYAMRIRPALLIVDGDYPVRRLVAEIARREGIVNPCEVPLACGVSLKEIADQISDLLLSGADRDAARTSNERAMLVFYDLDTVLFRDLHLQTCVDNLLFKGFLSDKESSRLPPRTYRIATIAPDIPQYGSGWYFSQFSRVRI